MRLSLGSKYIKRHVKPVWQVSYLLPTDVYDANATDYQLHNKNEGVDFAIALPPKREVIATSCGNGNL